jgi:hypothetical protein
MNLTIDQLLLQTETFREAAVRRKKEHLTRLLPFLKAG